MEKFLLEGLYFEKGYIPAFVIILIINGILERKILPNLKVVG